MPKWEEIKKHAARLYLFCGLRLCRYGHAKKTRSRISKEEVLGKYLGLGVLG